MPIYKSKTPTKDGRLYFFKVNYTDVFGNHKQYKSKKYSLRSEAIHEEAIFLSGSGTIDKKQNDMTFGQLYEKFYQNRECEVKETTKQNYANKYKKIECFSNIKCRDFNLEMFEQWKKEINDDNNISLSYKNELLKFFKSILNYGISWYNLDFGKLYRRITNFKDPNGIKKEMLFYTYDEFTKYISNVDDLGFRCLWELLYFAGLRCGEARGLMWKCIDFKNRKIIIDKQVQSRKGRKTDWYITTPKTRDSNRIIPMCDVLYEDLKKYHEIVSQYKNYNDGFYVTGRYCGLEPFTPDSVRNKNRENAKAVGLKYIRLHDFRHSCASLLINSGASPVMVSKYLGHTKIDVTLNTYSHMFQSALDEVVNIINDLSANI